MANPHKRCAVCKERHSPGNCKQIGGTVPHIRFGSAAWERMAAAVGKLILEGNDLVRFLEGEGDVAPFFPVGSVGAERVARFRKVLDSVVGK